MNVRIRSCFHFGLFLFIVCTMAPIAEATTLDDFPLLSPAGSMYGNCGPSPRCFSAFEDLRGDTAAVDGSGQLSLFVKQASGEWTLDAELLDPFAPLPRPYYNSNFGFRASIDGDVLAVAATPDEKWPSQVIYMFAHRQGVWSLTQTIDVPYSFGTLHLQELKLRDGALVVSQIEFSEDMTTRIEAKVLVYYAASDGQFHRLPDLNPAGNHNQGTPYRIALEGDTLALAMPADSETPGAVYIYERGEFSHHAPRWHLHQVLQPGQLTAAQGFANGVAISGDTMAISAPGVINPAPAIYPGTVFVYRRHEHHWSLRDRVVDPVTEAAPPDELTPSPSELPFGTMFALSGKRLLVKHLSTVDLGYGSDIVFEYRDGVWVPTARIGEQTIDDTLLSGSTALIAESPLNIFGDFLNIYDLPALQLATQDANASASD